MSDALLDRPVSLIGLPYWMGRRGISGRYQMARGPEWLLREESVPRALRAVFRDVDVNLIVDADDPSDEDTGGDFRRFPDGDQMSRYLIQNRRLAHWVADSIGKGRFPVACTGGCVPGIGMVAGLDDPDLGMVWFDAHGDAETPDTSTNGFMEGMVVSTIAGQCWPVYREKLDGFHAIAEERIVQVGQHEAHSAERRIDFKYRTVGQVVNPPLIAELGFERAMSESIERLSAHARRVYVHIDLDVLDTKVLRPTSHTADGGLSLDQLKKAVAIVADHVEIGALTFAAWDPSHDHRGATVIPPLVAEAAAIAVSSRSRSSEAVSS